MRSKSEVKEKCFAQSKEACMRPSPVGRLKRHVSEWKERSNKEYIMGIVQDGYKLPLKNTPPSVLLRINRSL